MIPTTLTSIGVGCSRAGRELLSDVSFEASPGTHTVIAGPNGAGKSTLLKVLAGDIGHDSGHVLLDGLALASWPLARLAERRAVMPQESQLTFAFTVLEVIGFGRHRLALGTDSALDAAVEAAMRATDTLHLQDRLFPTLSGGERARVTFARVLAQGCGLLLLDEPTASLDPKHQHLLMRIVRDLVDRGATVVTVLHDLNLAAHYADSVLLLKHGRVLAHGPTREVLTKTALEEAFESRFEIIERGGDRIIASLPV
ncbi:MAG: heme ABC transporter ATP-binding protein [Trueperaceae bacterium]|nr:heme ABC transporter ATP-binding protein [Trueperaceae bacterium]